MKKLSKLTTTLIMCSIALSGCGDEGHYEKAVQLIKEKKWEEANLELHDVSESYKDTVKLQDR